jgi:predicted RNase H-like nuclease
MCVTERDGSLGAAVTPQLGDWLDVHEPGLAAIDMPIGLTDQGPRACDVLARAALRPHRSASLFSPPVRAVLGHETYTAACAAHRAIDGRAISLQAWNIVPKIRELDTLLCDRPRWRTVLHEGHPELSFAHWNGGVPLSEPKRTAAGRALRRALVDAHWPGQLKALSTALRGAAFAADDLLDACALLWTARRIAAGLAHRLPSDAPLDREGLPMCITA